MKEIAPGIWAETGYRGCNNSCIVTDEGVGRLYHEVGGE